MKTYLAPFTASDAVDAILAKGSADEYIKVNAGGTDLESAAVSGGGVTGADLVKYDHGWVDVGGANLGGIWASASRGVSAGSGLAGNDAYGQFYERYVNGATTVMNVYVNANPTSESCTWYDLPIIETSWRNIGDPANTDYPINCFALCNVTGAITNYTNALAGGAFGVGCIETETGNRNLHFFSCSNSANMTVHAVDDGGTVAISDQLAYRVRFSVDSVTGTGLSATPTSVTITLLDVDGTAVDSHTFTAGGGDDMPAAPSGRGVQVGWISAPGGGGTTITGDHGVAAYFADIVTRRAAGGA